MSPSDPSTEVPALIGHGEAETALAQASSAGRLAHAWLFSGPDGVGKATLAVRFARHLLSGQPSTGEGLTGPAQDPNSRVYRLVAGDAHPDLLTIRRPEAPDKAGAKRPQDLPIDQVRRIPSFLSMSASEGGWRVVIVDEADRLSRNAANALLKVLEEPPARTVLILIAVMPGRLLPTIRSRCRRLSLERLSDADLSLWLDQSGLAVPEADKDLLIGLAEGSPGKLGRLIEAGGADAYRTLGAVVAGAGRMDWAAVHKLSDGLSRANAEAAYEMSAEMLTNWLQSAIRSLAGGTEAPPAPWLAQAGDGAQSAVQLDRLLKVWEKAQDLFAAAKSANLDKRTVLIQIFAALETAAKAR